MKKNLNSFGTIPSRMPLFALLGLVLHLAWPGSAVSDVILPESEITVPSVRMAALGGQHAALADDFHSLFGNPAGLAGAEQELSFAEVTLRASGPVFSLLGVIMEGMSGDMNQVFTSAEVQDLVRTLYASGELIGPLSFGFVGKGMGFGLFTTGRFSLESAGAGNLNARLGEHFLFSGGYGFRIPLPADPIHRLETGFVLKGFLNGDVRYSTTLFEVADLIAGDFLSELPEKPFALTSGIGIDWGLRYSRGERFGAGLSVRNLFTPALVHSYSTLNAFFEGSEEPVKQYARLPQNVSIGILYRPELRFLERYVSDFRIMVDYVDLIDFWTHPETSVNPVLHVGIGTEVLLLDILALRAGFSQGLFAAGFGLDLTLFRLNASMFGTELSGEPGMRPVYNVMLGLEFRY